MKKPFWLLNLILLALLISTIMFTLISKVNIPRYKPDSQDIAKKTVEVSQDNYSIIYEQDLFETTITPEPIPEPKPEKEKVIPTPPSKKRIAPPRPKRSKIVEPLPLKITGIMYFGDSKNDIAFIQNTRTKLEKLYSISDEIEDAQIIKIFNNKVILLRSNGQQEVLYLNSSEQEEEETFKKIDFAKKISEFEYEVKIDSFARVVPDLNELIFKMDIKNAIKNKKIIGLKIGNAENNNIANQIGLYTGDVVTHVAGISLNNNDSRFEAYETVSKLGIGDSFDIQIIRNNKKLNQKYVLTYDFKKIKNKNKGFNIDKIENRKNKLEDSMQSLKARDMKNFLKSSKAKQ